MLTKHNIHPKAIVFNYKYEWEVKYFASEVVVWFIQLKYSNIVDCEYCISV